MASAVVEDVAKALEEGTSSGMQTSSAHGLARCLDMPASTVHKIIRNILHCYPYKMINVQELLSDGLPRREAFVLEFLVRMVVNEWPWKISWTYAAYFRIHGFVNTQIAGYGQRKSYSKLHQRRCIRRR